ncbi:VWA domain-containing protein [Nocardioides yefusunii]|uniref:VWA domain-containing protein n=1 Tax=Nocardioides yefusunii TaxID=2500546 RepID=A0ABW1R2T4_9ACTN|nr:VWA domain-containing protein [Nocardioides yefusunii]
MANTGRHTEASRKGLASIALVLALVAGVGGLGWMLFKPDSAGSAGNCDGARKVVVSVSAALEAPMERAIQELGRDECFPAQMRVESPNEVEESFFNGGRPDLWVADTPARVDRLTSLNINTTTLNPSLAFTPVGLVGGERSVQHSSWFEALGEQEVVYGDPNTDGATALTLMAPTMERDLTKTKADDATYVVTDAARAYGEEMANIADLSLPAHERLKEQSGQLAPITEQEYVTLGAASGLIDRTPDTGAPALTFPLVKANGGAPQTDLVAEQLTGWFASPAGADALAAAHLRAPDGAALAGPGFEAKGDLGDVPSEAFNLLISKFSILIVPTSLLSVFDVSGSMNRQWGNEARIELAKDVALMALDKFGEPSRIGLWVFSTDKDGPGKDYKEIAEMKRLSENTNGMTHREFLNDEANRLQNYIGGSTGLYDTTLAAYKKALEEFDRSYYNVVVILTDGKNEDENSISLKQLTKQLTELRDRNRDIRVISIGLTKDADMAALTEISAATGGSAYLAEEPNDVLTVLGEAMLERG